MTASELQLGDVLCVLLDDGEHKLRLHRIWAFLIPEPTLEFMIFSKRPSCGSHWLYGPEKWQSVVDSWFQDGGILSVTRKDDLIWASPLAEGVEG